MPELQTIMGNRLTKIYTRTGDDGSTGLAQGGRIAKDSPRIEAIGAIDELNSALGLLLASLDKLDLLREPLERVQHRLFDMGGILALPNHSMGLDDSHVQQLETLLDDLNADLPPLRDFILPGGCHAAALAHLARSVCRRSERRLISLHKVEPIPSVCLQYLNRLSDVLFVLARHINKLNGYDDLIWKPAAKAPQNA